MDAERSRLSARFPEIAKTPVPPPAPRRPSCAEELGALIDHTLLKPEATWRDAEETCLEAIAMRCAAACLAPRFAKRAGAILRGSGVRLCVVVGFPHGNETPEQKAFSAAQATAQGAQEIDMVLSIGALREGEFLAVYEEIQGVRAAAQDALLKVILETAALTDQEKVQGALLAAWAGADYVKTSTGFGAGGATVRDVALLRTAVGGLSGVKASGGIRSLEDALAMLEAGASRLGMSATRQVLVRYEEAR
ncbi:MAG: deoxyribose-phosphate aldolase [Thermaerobacter sp.]|nr:deoxyribose-phosphate aldolase [Thermaerobacter sp.]